MGKTVSEEWESLPDSTNALPDNAVSQVPAQQRLSFGPNVVPAAAQVQFMMRWRASIDAWPPDEPRMPSQADELFCCAYS